MRVESNNALNLWVKRTQSISFVSEISDKKFSKSLRKLDVFHDDENVLRVG